MHDASDVNISLLHRVKLQTEVLIPVLKALRRELGEERANRIVYSAFREWSRQSYRQMGSNTTDSGKAKWAAISKELDDVIGEDVMVDNLKDDAEAFEFNVTGCRYAQHFMQLGEPELGAIMTCEIDDHVAALGYPEVELSRPQTIMGGAKECHFRYRFRMTKSD